MVAKGEGGGGGGERARGRQRRLRDRRDEPTTREGGTRGNQGPGSGAGKHAGSASECVLLGGNAPDIVFSKRCLVGLGDSASSWLSMDVSWCTGHTMGTQGCARSGVVVARIHSTPGPQPVTCEWEVHVATGVRGSRGREIPGGNPATDGTNRQNAAPGLPRPEAAPFHVDDHKTVTGPRPLGDCRAALYVRTVGASACKVADWDIPGAFT